MDYYQVSITWNSRALYALYASGNKDMLFCLRGKIALFQSEESFLKFSEERRLNVSRGKIYNYDFDKISCFSQGDDHCIGLSELLNGWDILDDINESGLISSKEFANISRGARDLHRRIVLNVIEWMREENDNSYELTGDDFLRLREIMAIGFSFFDRVIKEKTIIL